MTINSTNQRENRAEYHWMAGSRRKLVASKKNNGRTNNRIDSALKGVSPQRSATEFRGFSGKEGKEFAISLPPELRRPTEISRAKCSSSGKDRIPG